MTKEEVNFVKELQDKIDHYDNQIKAIKSQFDQEHWLDNISIKVCGYGSRCNIDKHIDNEDTISICDSMIDILTTKAKQLQDKLDRYSLMIKAEIK